MATTTKSTTRKKASATAKAKKPTSKKSTKSVSSKAKSSSVKKSAPKTASKTTSKLKKVQTKFEELNVWNFVLAFLHTAQGVAVIILSRDSLFPVTTNYLTADTITDSGVAPTLVPATRHLFDINLAYLVAAFFFLSAAAHLYIATVYRKKYEHNLEHGINKARWFEYGLSASVMMVGIAILAGVSDLSTIVLIFGATSVMNLLGLMMEVHNQTTKKTNWLSYLIGVKSGLLSWVAVGLYLWGASQYGEGTIPTFVYYIFASMLALFSSFAVNMYLQYRGKGRWSDYLHGEKMYMVLSLVAKSALAWQIFFGTLRP